MQLMENQETKGKAAKKTRAKLPPIPDKRYFTIGEVADLCAVKPHVLRYWEQEFSELSPTKRRGNRRYYQYEDVQMVRQIRHLLYEQGFTIGGARLQLSANQARGKDDSPAFQTFIKESIRELEEVLVILQS